MSKNEKKARTFNFEELLGKTIKTAQERDPWTGDRSSKVIFFQNFPAGPGMGSYAYEKGGVRILVRGTNFFQTQVTELVHNLPVRSMKLDVVCLKCNILFYIIKFIISKEYRKQ